MSAIDTIGGQIEVLRRENTLILRENDNLREIQRLTQLLQNQSSSPNKRSRTDIDVGTSVESHSTHDPNSGVVEQYESPIPLANRLKMTPEAQEQLKGILLGDLMMRLHGKGMIKKFVREDGTFDRDSLTLSFVQRL